MMTFVWLVGIGLAICLSCAALVLAWMKVEMEGHMAREIMSLGRQVREIEGEVAQLGSMTDRWSMTGPVDVFGGHP
jgi:hypothetical protein